MKKISCLICAYNEEPRIGKVLKVVTAHPDIKEILVVNDGSTDQTAAAVRRHKKVKLIDLKKNQGKTHALLTGLEAVKNDWVLLLDADLSPLTAKDITDLLEPVLSGRADCSLSLRKNSLLVHQLIGLDFSSGERVFSKKLLDGHQKEIKKLPRFGFEVFMNELLIKNRSRLAIVPWKNVSHARKTEKMGFWKGEWAELQMTWDMVKSVGLKKIVTQNLSLLKLARKKQAPSV